MQKYKAGKRGKAKKRLKNKTNPKNPLMNLMCFKQSLTLPTVISPTTMA